MLDSLSETGGPDIVRYVYLGKPCTAPAPALANALAMKALDGRLAIYAGAGVSRAQPTNLPTGPGLADAAADWLTGRVAGLRKFKTGDLLDFADAVEEQPGGRDLLQEALVRLARFDEAEPNDAHHVLAILALEGLATVLTTNWDDCIERAAGDRQRLQAIVTDDDYAHVRGATVMKLHGCVTRRGSLLVSTEDLKSPPAWVITEVAPRLAAATTVFIGIGDVADYIKVRLRQVLKAMGTGADIRLVGPDVIAKWDDLAWSSIPEATLPLENRVEQTAEEFLDDLLRALLGLRFADMRRELADCIAAGITDRDAGLFVDQLEGLSGLAAIAWLRGSLVRLPSGHPSDGGSLRTALLAVGRLVAAGAVPIASGWLRLDDSYVLIVVGDDTIPGPRLKDEATTRIARARGRGLLKPSQAILALCAGYRGQLPTGDLMRADLLDAGPTRSVVTGFENPVSYLDANNVLTDGI